MPLRDIRSIRPVDAKTAISDFRTERGDGADGAILLMFDMDNGKLGGTAWARRKRDKEALNEVLHEIMDMLFTGEISMNQPGDEPPTPAVKASGADGYDMIG